MSRCAFEFAEGDGGNPPPEATAQPDLPVFSPGYGSEDLPGVSTLVRADLRGVIPQGTIQTLSGEAASGAGAEAFADGSSGEGYGLGFWLLVAAGAYLAIRQN